MSRKHFSWLFFLTLLVAGLVLILPGTTSRKSSLEPSALVPGAAARINDVDWVRLNAAGGVTIATLKREGKIWVVEEASGYRADWGRLKTLLAAVSQATVIEAKTDNPEYYPRLGVEDVSLPDAGGVMIEFSGDSGLPALIIGNKAQGREGQYVRLRDVAETALIDRRLDVPAERLDWIDKNVVDIPDEEVVEVRIEHPDGETINTIRASADDENFLLQDIPEGMEIKSDWNVNALAGALAALDLESVVPEGDFEWDNAIRLSLLTADGLLLESDLLAVETGAADGVEDEAAEQEYWLRLQAGLYTTAIGNDVETGGENMDTENRAKSIDSRVTGWAYRVPQHKFDSIAKRNSDLLKPSE